MNTRRACANLQPPLQQLPVPPWLCAPTSCPYELNQALWTDTCSAGRCQALGKRSPRMCSSVLFWEVFFAFIFSCGDVRPAQGKGRHKATNRSSDQRGVAVVVRSVHIPAIQEMLYQWSVSIGCSNVFTMVNYTFIAIYCISNAKKLLTAILKAEYEIYYWAHFNKTSH